MLFAIVVTRVASVKFVPVESHDKKPLSTACDTPPADLHMPDDTNTAKTETETVSAQTSQNTTHSLTQETHITGKGCMLLTDTHKLWQYILYLNMNFSYGILYSILLKFILYNFVGIVSFI